MGKFSCQHCLPFKACFSLNWQDENVLIFFQSFWAAFQVSGLGHTKRPNLC
jgi:hypothetical protein